MSDFESQEDEIEALQSIYTEEEFHSFKDDKSIQGQFNAFVSVPEGYTVFYRKTELPGDVSGNCEETKILGDATTFEKSLNVQYLPPVQLRFKLPPDYPSKAPPKCIISCPWLTNKQLRKLSIQLLKIYNDNKGCVVLYSWAEFLKDECLVFLKLDKALDVSAVEEAQRARRRKSNCTKKPEQSGEALTNISNKLGKNPVTDDGKEHLKREEEVCTVVDLSSISDKEKEKQALLVKLSLYSSGLSEESDSMKVERSLYETSHPTREIDITEMIVFDQNLEVKRSLYCSTSENQDVPDVPEEEREKPGPSNCNQYNQGLANSRLKVRKKKVSKKPRQKRYGMTVWDLRLTEPLWNIIVDYNKMRRKRDFDFQMFCCAVCFEEKMGSHCMELENCNHIFCRDCLTSFLHVCIMDGKVKQLTCPETDCDTELFHSEIRSLVSPEHFAKYDSFLLSSTLDTLNVTYCPRKFCQYPVSPDKETMALCPQCDYCFCPFCKMVYHGVEPCRFKLDSEETKALIKEYGNCSESRKNQLEKRYGRKHLQQLLDTSLSQSWISSNSKQCPNCNSSIERTYGCNKMVCLRCNTPFCWLCFEILDNINPYRHFQDGRCAGKLYLGMQGEREDEEEMDEGDLDDEFDDDEEFIFFDERVPLYHNGIVYL